MKPTLLILAAGVGSRYGKLKQLDEVGPSGEALFEYSIYDAILAGFAKVVFVINKKIEERFRIFIKNKFAGKIAVEFAFPYRTIYDVKWCWVISPRRTL